MSPVRYERIPGWTAHWDFLYTVFNEAPHCHIDLVEVAIRCPKVKFDAPELAPIRSQIRQWGHLWQLNDEWCFEYALMWVLLYRHYSPSFSDADPETWAAAQNSPNRAPSIHFECPGWDCTSETRQEFEARVLKYAEQALREDRDGADRKARAVGLELVSEKRNPEHFNWLARYQCRNESVAKIWKSLLKNPRKRGPGEPSRQSVRQAIERTATEIGLTLRQDAAPLGHLSRRREHARSKNLTT
jgi:hypothetical protein